MRKDDYKYFVDNHDCLTKNFNGKYIVISSKEVVFSCDKMNEAIKYVDSKKMPPEDYIIQLCTEGETAFVTSFCSLITYV